MSRRFILDADEASGQFSTFEYDPAEDMYLLKHGQDLTALAEANKREYNGDKTPLHKMDGLGRKVASIDLHTFFKLYKEGIVRDRKAFRRWLNDPANRYCRTSPEQV